MPSIEPREGTCVDDQDTRRRKKQGRWKRVWEEKVWPDVIFPKK